MINIDVKNLNSLEASVYQRLVSKLETNKSLRIIEAGETCGVSPSKISKLVAKLGFENYKQFRQFVSNEEIDIQKQAPEIQRVIQHLRNFNTRLVNDFVSLLLRYNKIILLGYGPTYYCLEYFAHKLKFILKKHVIVTQDEMILANQVDKECLVVGFTVTGQYKSFASVFESIKDKVGEVVIVIEEKNEDIQLSDYVVYLLTQTRQNEDLQAYEKSRTLFFIFIEQICLHLLERE